MATKLSAVTQKTGTNADDLLLLASTEDSGSSYASKAIKISNLFSSVASGTDLGTFTGSTLSANASVKTALQELETAHETEVTARGAAITAAINALVDAAPGTLDTLNEIAAAINDDADVFTTLTTSIAAVQADVDQNEADGDSGRALLAGLITALTATVAALDTKTVDGGDNVNNLVASTTPDTTPATFYFLAVDASTGAIKVVNKNFVEVE
jgi:ABC-type transporter Mla subunit MlaD